MSIDPRQLQILQQQMNTQKLQPLTPEDLQGGQPPQGIPPELMAQMQQNPNALGMMQPPPPPNPMEELNKVALLACQVFTKFANDPKLDVQVQAGALSQMSQVLGNIFGQLNQPDPQQEIEFKVAEFQMSAQEKELDMQMKREEFEMKKAEAQMKLQAEQIKAQLKVQETTMNIQNKQIENSLNLEQKEKENKMNIIHKENEHKSKMAQQKQAQQSKPVKKPSN